MGAFGSTADARLLKESSIYPNIINENLIRDRVLQTGDFGEVPLVTIGHNAFPQFAWLIKTCYKNTRDNQKKYFTKRLCGARVVFENAYGMLKERCRILFKKKQNVSFSAFIILEWFALLYTIYVLKYLILANQDGEWKSTILILFKKICVRNLV